MDPRLTGIAGRLAQALGDREKPEFTTAMQRRMKGRGGQAGVSYQTVLAYFNGKSIPSLEWLVEAAAELGVRPEWLAFEQGLPKDDRSAEEVAHLVAPRMPYPLNGFTVARISNLAAALYGARWGSGDATTLEGTNAEQAAADILAVIEAIMHPVRALDLDNVPPRFLNSYASMVTEYLHVLREIVDAST